MKQNGLYAFFLLVLLFILSTCVINKDGFTSRPVRSDLNPEPELLEAEALAFHLNDSVTRIFFRIANDRLLYKRPDSSKVFYAHVKISYRLVPIDQPRFISDSSSMQLYDDSPSETVPFAYINGFIDLKARHQLNYDLDLILWDMHRRTKYRMAMPVIKENRYGSQNFLISKGDSIVYRNSFIAGDQLSVKYTYEQTEMLTVQCFKQPQGPALPPFSLKTQDEVRVKSDSVYYIETNTSASRLKMPNTGFVLIKASKTAQSGVCLFTVDESFPGVAGSKEMIQCTRYIMSKDEYESCLTGSDQKAAIDDFWLNIGGSRERARELLKRYYGRVLNANRSYSSYLPGWKTDRGMIYIVMGTPTKIYRSQDAETWVYGNEAGVNLLRFVFVRAAKPFTQNDLVLERSTMYRDPYHLAVEYWRQGVVFNDGSH